MFAVWRSASRAFVVLLVILVLTLGAVLLETLRLADQQNRESVQRHALDHSALAVEFLAPLVTTSPDRVYRFLNDSRSSGVILGGTVLGPDAGLVAAVEPPRLQTPFAGDTPRIRHTEQLLGIDRPIHIAGQLGAAILQLDYPLPPISATTWLASSGAIALGGLLAAITILGLTLLPLRRGVDGLAEAIRRMQAGDWRSSVDADGIMAPISDALNSLAGDQQQRMGKLRREAEQRQLDIQRLNSMLRESRTVVWEADPQTGQFSYISEAAQRLLGHPLSAWLSADFIQQWVHPNDRAWLRDYFTQPGSESDTINIDLRVRNAQGDWRWVRLLGTIELRDQGAVPVGLLQDITAERENEQKLAHLADHDPLTGLFSRPRWRALSREIISREETNSPGVAFVLFDMARFKLVNELFGPDTGDEFLIQASAALGDLISETEQGALGRLGNDEFGLLIPNCDAEDSVQIVAELLADLGARQFVHDGQQIPFIANAGIALYPIHSFKSGELLAHADTALRVAKSNGAGLQHLYDDADIAKQLHTLTWSGQIRKALENDRFQLLFQPVVDIRNGAIRHYETRLRWLDGSADSKPEIWRDSAELLGLATAIDRWAVVHSLEYQHSAANPGNEPSLIVRLTGQHLAKPEILEHLNDTSRLFKLGPGLVTLAIDTQSIAENLESAQTFVRLAHQLGQRFAINRFGADGLSLVSLQELPVDMIRLDERLVRRLHWNTVNQAFVKATIEIARGMNVPVTAPGVEQAQTVDMLQSLGVRHAQGDYFAKPEARFHELGRVVIAQPA